MSYKCETCKHNNNGWCNQKKMNGLRKKNIQECEEYKTTGTEFCMYKSFDAMDTPHLTITINDEEIFIPTEIITDFINGDGKKIEVIFHEEE